MKHENNGDEKQNGNKKIFSTHLMRRSRKVKEKWDEVSSQQRKNIFHTVAGETRVACVKLGVLSSIFEFLCPSFGCCCDDPPTDVDAVVDEDEEELEAPCCP